MERYDLEAYDQLAQVSRSFYKWSHGKLDYFEDLRAKGDERHVYLMFAGLLEGGIHALTERSLRISLTQSAHATKRIQKTP